jgi:hypothetical protein
VTRQRKSRRSAFRFTHHLVDVIAVETFKRAHIVSRPGRIDTDEHHRGLALGAKMTRDFVGCKAKSGSVEGTFRSLIRQDQRALSRRPTSGRRAAIRDVIPPHRLGAGQNSSGSPAASCLPGAPFYSTFSGASLAGQGVNLATGLSWLRDRRISRTAASGAFDFRPNFF